MSTTYCYCLLKKVWQANCIISIKPVTDMKTTMIAIVLLAVVLCFANTTADAQGWYRHPHFRRPGRAFVRYYPPVQVYRPPAVCYNAPPQYCPPPPCYSRHYRHYEGHNHYEGNDHYNNNCNNHYGNNNYGNNYRYRNHY